MRNTIPLMSVPAEWLTEVISHHGLGWGLLAVFIGGLALNLTPCVYPMIPVTLAFFSQQAAGAIRRTTLLAVVYVLGISLCYAALGLLAAKTGVLLGSWLQKPVVLVGIAAVIVALSLSLFGLYDIRPPQAVMRRLGESAAGVWGAFVMGLVVGVVAAPCIGPFVLGLLLLVGQSASPVTGFLLFFVLGLGMGLPYIVLGVAANRLGHLPRAGSWLVWSKKVLGIGLLGVAFYLVQSLLPAGAVKLGVSALLLGAGVYLGWLERTHGGRRFVWMRRLTGVGFVAAALAVAWPQPPAGPRVAWQPYSTAGLERALSERRPVVIDVYADWCLPCVEMDQVTFRYPGVVEALQSVATLRVDATREVSPEAEALFKRYDVFGVPTVLLFDRTGAERKGLRLLGFVTPEEFLERLRQLQ